MNTELIFFIVGSVLFAVLIIFLIILYKKINSKQSDAELTHENERLRQELNTLSGENIRKDTSLSSLQSSLEEKQSLIDKSERELKELRFENINLSNDVTRMKLDAAFVKEKNANLSSEVEKLKQEYSDLSLALAKKNEQITEQQLQNNVLQEQKQNMSILLKQREDELFALQASISDLNRLYSETRAVLSAEKEKNENLRKSYEEYKLSVEALNKQSEEHLQNLTNKILEEKTKKFSETNSKEIENIVKPLKEQIAEFKNKIEDSNERQTKLHTSLEMQIKAIVSQTKAISEDAVNLTNALKGENKRAGNWGEHILETILQNSGLIKGIHFFEQQGMKDANNQKLIPDFIVSLPSDSDNTQNNIIIDSKLSLVAYERYFNAEEESQKEIYLREHIKSVRNHIDELADKNYELLNKGSVGFVMMFIPVEPAYLLAVQSDVTLWEYAYRKKVILMSATNMIPALRLVADLWKIDTRNREAQSMAEVCGAIYDKILVFLDTFEDVGSAIKKASEQYGKASAQLSTGKGNVVRRLQLLQQKGIATKNKRQLPKIMDSQNEEVPDEENVLEKGISEEENR